uniref:RING-type E3 ubiquitin transferase n=1 Tax=Kalanchoe fedtschenkoi TaxID=63787 RepID=A0A7N0UF30_KALFE
MRLDVDNMTYEELLALEESIGSVTTGLSKQVVMQSLTRTTFFTFAERGIQKECCSICQEDYVEDDELGTLTCGHGFHVQCIEQWLTCKNLCPLCKSAGLSTSSSSH